MKKNLFVALLALTCSFTACAKDQVITYDQVPEPAKAIVAAGAVVTKDVPANTIVGGVPAKILKTID